jgi:hypothetical protein
MRPLGRIFAVITSASLSPRSLKRCRYAIFAGCRTSNFDNDICTLRQLETAQTHDDLWNAAQIQMLRYGWMHNYLSMYWTKKLLECTPDAATAVR